MFLQINSSYIYICSIYNINIYGNFLQCVIIFALVNVLTNRSKQWAMQLLHYLVFFVNVS